MKTKQLDAKTFTNLRHLNGLSQRTVDDLYETYRTYVIKTNEVHARLKTTNLGEADAIYSEFRTLKMEQASLLGAVKSFELFFTHLGGQGGKPTGLVLTEIERQYGDWAAFLKELTATALASRSWATLCYDRERREVLTLVLDTPGALTAWNIEPVLMLDVSERACSTEFGRNRRGYVEALLKNIDWARVEHNLAHALELEPVLRSS